MFLYHTKTFLETYLNSINRGNDLHKFSKILLILRNYKIQNWAMSLKKYLPLVIILAKFITGPMQHEPILPKTNRRIK